MFRTSSILAAPILAALAFSGAAQAHPKLLSSTPAANARIAKTAQIDLVYNEKLMSANTRIQLVMTSMPGMANHAAMRIPISVRMTKDGKSLIVMSRQSLTTGSYELSWTASGDDKEVVNGKLAFQVK
jgi:methionine-rich copper-binding protein CopC